ncbi:hypothetical protein FHS43_003898 [Streptosporangium becharense]|uniref:Uncharacterized protein n=1 Tax=Streptosporangium becharense TaxID=1816182 RepID=A0A7W9MH45_9ACTN|nr:hypothetical protein [Streptosporangium becharense]MBB2912615.1 hypothetical protein [Streptosporangium becharense]MBB5820555.1 hypothetical protein [Streptosporangium becharense]
MTTYILSIVEGDAGAASDTASGTTSGAVSGAASGTDLFSPASPISFSELDPYTLMWLTEHGYEEPGRRVVVTPAGHDPAGVRVIASRDVDL